MNLLKKEVLYNTFPEGYEMIKASSWGEGSRKCSMCYLSDSWQIYQCEVDNVRRKYLQMNGFIADPLQRDKEE